MKTVTPPIADTTEGYAPPEKKQPLGPYALLTLIFQLQAAEEKGL